MAQQRRSAAGSAKRTQPEKAAPKRTEERAAYTPAKPFNRKKLALQLLTVATVALAIAIGLSIFFKVDTISVAGLEKYNYNTVVDVSGIQKGDSLVFFSRAEVSSKILQSLPYVRSVRIGISLPGTVNILIEEVDVVYSIRDSQGNWWLISTDGTVLEKIDGATATSITTIEGVRITDPAVGAKAAAAEETADPDTPVTVTGADRLNAALQILQALESNELLSEFSTVDVSSVYDLQLRRGSDYQFKLGDSSDLNLKIAYVKSALPQILKDYPSGTLDVSDPTNSDGFPFTEFG